MRCIFDRSIFIKLRKILYYELKNANEKIRTADMENIVVSNDLIDDEVNAAKLENDRLKKELNNYFEKYKSEIEKKDLRIENLQKTRTNQIVSYVDNLEKGELQKRLVIYEKKISERKKMYENLEMKYKVII